MIKTSTYEEVIRLSMGRDMDGSVLYWVSAYLVDGMLIDTGCKHTAEELYEYLKNLKLSKAVNTHYHEDHIGGNKIIQDKLNVNILAPPKSIPLINETPSLYPYQELVWGYPDQAEITPIEGDTIKTPRYTFEAIEAPGHSRDHIVLIEPGQGWCFSGDLFVSEKPKVIRPEEDIAEIIRSMKKLIELPYNFTMFPSVGGVVLNGKEAMSNCVEYLSDLHQRSKQLAREGLTPPEIRDSIFGKESTLAMLTDGQFSSENLIKSLLTMN